MRNDFSTCVLELKSFFSESLAAPGPQVPGAFARLALELFRLQYQFNRPYQALCDARGRGPDVVANWTEIPAVPTSAFKELALTCLEESDRVSWFESSGTTQTARSRTHHSAASLDLYQQSLLPWFRHHLVPETLSTESRVFPAMNFLSLTPSRQAAPHSSLVHMLDTVSRQPWIGQVTFAGWVERSGWTVDLATCQSALASSLTAARPVLVAGTAFSFVHLMDALGSERYPLPAGSRVLETGGYKGRSRSMKKAELHAAISNTLGVPPEFIVTEYGMTELGSQAYDQTAGRAGRRMLRFPPWAQIRVVSPETGREVPRDEAGLVQVVDLANAFSVVAVETEDIAIRRDEGIELIGRGTLAEPRGCSLQVV
jgi:hypothetical protein